MSTHNRRNHHFLKTTPLFVFAATLFCCFVIAPKCLRAQDAFPGWQHDQTLQERKAETFQLLRAGTLPERQSLDQFFDSCYFSEWTIPENHGKTQDFVQALLEVDFKDLNGAGRNYLLEKSLDSLRRMALDNAVNPIARYNAMYALGRLNAADSPTSRDPAVAYAPALAVLVGEMQNDNTPQSLRLAALLGIHRHVFLGIADETMRQTTIPNLLYKVIADGAPNQSRSPDEQAVLDWMRLRAIEALGGLKAIGDNVTLVDTLLQLMTNTEETIEVRCTVARVFGMLDYAAGADTGINYQMIGSALVQLTKSICENEMRMLDTLRDRERAASSTSGSSYSSPSYSSPSYSSPGSSYSATNENAAYETLPLEKRLEIDASVQRIKSHLSDIVTGMRGRLNGSPNGGIYPLLENTDPVAVQMLNVYRTVLLTFKMLDTGPEEPEPDPNSPYGPSTYVSSTTTRAADLPENHLKVNLAIIRAELEKLRIALDGITSDRARP